MIVSHTRLSKLAQALCTHRLALPGRSVDAWLWERYLIIKEVCVQPLTMAHLQIYHGISPILSIIGKVMLLFVPSPPWEAQAALENKALLAASSSQECPLGWTSSHCMAWGSGSRTHPRFTHTNPGISSVLWPVGPAVAYSPGFPLSLFHILFGSFPFCVNGWSS